MRDNLESVRCQQRAVLIGSEACVIQRFSFECPDRLVKSWSAGEHQRRARRGVPGKNGNHQALIIGCQMKETVPCENSAKLPVQRELPHVRDNPRLPGKSRSTQLNHIPRTVDTHDRIAPLDDVACDRFRHSAAEIKNRTTAGNQSQKLIEPVFLEQSAPALLIECRRVPVV
jgi:hypothetical protein